MDLLDLDMLGSAYGNTYDGVVPEPVTLTLAEEGTVSQAKVDEEGKQLYFVKTANRNLQGWYPEEKLKLNQKPKK